MSKPNNPPAFPHAIGTPGDPWGSLELGMTLRDYFAASCAPKLIDYWTSGEDGTPNSSNDIPYKSAELIASDAYYIADAMLKAREATNV